MNLRIYAFILFVVLILVSCNKSEDKDNNSADTLKQYLEYTVNDSLVRLTENDTITFYPGFTTTTKGNDTSDFIYSSDLEVAVEHNMGSYSIFRHNTFSFVIRLPHNQMDWTHKTNNNYDPILDRGVFESLFQTGEMNYLPQHCYDSILNILNVGISFPFYYDFNKSFISYSGCLSEFEENMYKQDNSYFRINSIKKYQHKKFGDCILLEGEFKVILYYAAGAPWMEKLNINNGRFKFLVTNNHWQL